MTGLTLTGSAGNQSHLVKAHEDSSLIGKSANDESSIKKLTFGDTNAWRQKSILSHAFYYVMSKYYRGSKNKPFPIRTRAPTLTRHYWRKLNIRGGIKREMRACGVRTNKDGRVSSGEFKVEKKSGDGKNNITAKFDWKFYQKVELNFNVRTKCRSGSETQTLQGFAYSVRKQTKEDSKSVKKPEPINPDPVQVPDFNQNDRPIVVFFTPHSIPVERWSYQGYCGGMRYVQEKQANFLALNYRGYGGSSDGVPSNQSMVEDGLAIVNHLLETGIDPKRIILHGESMGGNIAANVAEAAETKGHTLGGLILDCPMEKLSTGLDAMIEPIKPRNSVAKYILSLIVRNVVRFLCESYNTSKTLKSLLRKRDLFEKKQEKQDAPKKAWTPVVGVYDEDPIGDTSRRMFEARGIENHGTNARHNAGLRETLNALDTLHGKSSKEEPNSAINRLYENFDVKPPDDV